MIQLFQNDAMTFLQHWKSRVDAIITDPVYDADFSWYGLCRKVCPTGNIIAFCKPENQWPNPDERLYWIKTPSTKNYIKKCGRFVEMIMVYRGDWSTFNCLHWSQMTGVYTDPGDEANGHPWQKPMSLMERLIKIYTNPGDTVLDPFMGSCSTGEACLRTQRHFYGIENNPEYFKLAQARIDRYS